MSKMGSGNKEFNDPLDNSVSDDSEDAFKNAPVLNRGGTNNSRPGTSKPRPDDKKNAQPSDPWSDQRAPSFGGASQPAQSSTIRKCLKCGKEESNPEKKYCGKCYTDFPKAPKPATTSNPYDNN